MRKFLLPLMVTSLFLACNSDKKSETPKEADKVMADSPRSASTTMDMPMEARVFEKLLGSFVGAFGDNKITLLIIKATKDSVLGRSIVGGNDRPFAGTVIEKEGNYTIAAKEPGDHPDDGVFNFSINDAKPDVVTGTWKPNNTKRPEKQYNLERKKFEYKPAAGEFPETSVRLLKPKDVENMMKEDLEFMRNEIFARHGFCFKKKNLRQQFEMMDWYVPNTVDIKGFLTDVEKKNISLIKRYEKYADEYGDEYGR
ncbi:MAG: YARHG domain-containing protein [Bacteroidota bacterium]